MMQKHIFLTLLSIVIGCSLAILILIAAAKNELNHKNSFNRFGIITPIVEKKILLNQPPGKILGIYGDTIFISTNQHGKLRVINTENKLQDSLGIPLPYDQRFLTAYDLSVNYPMVEVFAKNYGGYFEYKKRDTGVTVNQIVQLQPTLLTRAVKVSDSTVILRAFDANRTYQNFKKVSLRSGKILNSVNLFDIQSDAGFSTDGLLLYDSSLSRVLYIQFYKNSFYCLDTNLTLKYIGRTIDTVSTNSILTRKTRQDSIKGSVMPTTPLIPINKIACVNSGRLYILSTLKADNELRSAFENNSVLDVYDLKDGQYQGSIYLPNENGKKVMDFKVANNKLYAIYRQALIISNIKEKE